MDIMHNTGKVNSYGSFYGVTKEKVLYCVSCAYPFLLVCIFHAWCIGTERVKRRPRALLVKCNCADKKINGKEKVTLS